MLAEIATGLSSLKAATDILKGLNAANTQAAINEVKLDLGQRMLEAQRALTAADEAQNAALHRIRELEQEIARFKDWEADKKRYQLKELYRGLFAYIPKEGMENGEPPHALCTNCYQRGQKSLLQTSGHVVAHDHFWFCPNCKTSMKSQFRDMSGLIKKTREVERGGQG